MATFYYNHVVIIFRRAFKETLVISSRTLVISSITLAISKEVLLKQSRVSLKKWFCNNREYT